MRAEIPIGASRQAVWDALTNPRTLEAWFCEHADVDLDAGRYDFWGIYTPDTPSRAEGHHDVLKLVDGELLRYAWRVRDVDSIVEVRLHDSADETVVTVTQDPVARPQPGGTDVPGFWSLALLGLRSLVELGRPGVALFDFRLPRSEAGRIEVSVDVDAPREDVYGILVAGQSIAGEPLPLAEQWWVSDARRGEVAFDPPGSASTPCTVGDAETVLTWTLVDSGGRTRVTLVNSGFAIQPGEVTGTLGWTAMLVWLKLTSEIGPRWLERQRRVVMEDAWGWTMAR